MLLIPIYKNFAHAQILVTGLDNSFYCILGVGNNPAQLPCDSTCDHLLEQTLLAELFPIRVFGAAELVLQVFVAGEVNHPGRDITPEKRPKAFEETLDSNLLDQR